MVELIIDPMTAWEQHVKEAYWRANLWHTAPPTAEELEESFPQKWKDRLAEMERLSEENYRRNRIAEQRKPLEKELERESAKLDKLLDKRARMLFCAGVTNKASETARAQARNRLEKTKSWRGCEYDIDCCRRHIEYLEAELKDLI